MLNFWPVNKLRDIALKNIIVSAPHLANPTIKPRCYSGRGGGLLSIVHHSPYGVRARRNPQQVLVPGVARSRSQHTRGAGEIAQRKCVAGWVRTRDLGSGTMLARPT